MYTIQRDFHDAPRLYETQKNGDAITYSRKLAYKTLALTNDWESLLIRNQAYCNVKLVPAGMVISQEFHNKKAIRYLNKENVS